MSEISLAEFPWEVKEGVVFFKIGNKIRIINNEERNNRIKAKMDSLYKKD